MTYEKREVTFNGTAIDDGRTMEAKGRALLQDGRQEVRLASASLSAAGITWRTRDNAEALIVHDGETVAVTGLQVVNGDQQVTADGVVGVKEGTPSTLKIQAENVDLAQAATLASAVDPKMKPPDPRMAGKLSANARVTGTLQEPAVAGTFSVVGGAFRDVTYQSLGGQVSYDRKRIGVDIKLEQSPGTALTARGSLPLSLIAGGDAAKATGPEDVVDLQVQSTPIDLGLIQGLTTAVTNVTGQMQLDMRVKGRGRDVAFEGFVKVDQGAFAVTATGAQYTGLNTSLQFEPSRLVVDGLRILDDGNDPLEVKGVLGLTGTRFGTLDLTAHAKAFELLHNEMGEAEVNMDLKIGGEITAPQVSGTVAVERGRIEIDRLLRASHGGRVRHRIGSVRAGRRPARIRGRLDPDVDTGPESHAAAGGERRRERLPRLAPARLAHLARPRRPRPPRRSLANPRPVSPRSLVRPRSPVSLRRPRMSRRLRKPPA